MLMVLPRKLGGYGLRKPEIRHEFATSSEVLLFLSGKSTAFALHWPDAGLLLRYGDRAHKGNDGDRKRNRHLVSLGVAGSMVLHVTNRNDLQYDFAARQAELRKRVLTGN